MRRCCFFFLAFVAAILMAVVTDAFDNRNGIKHEVADSAQATVANQGDKKVTGQSPVEIKATDPFKKSEP